MLKAFGIAVFTAQGASKPAPTIVGEINAKLAQLGVDVDAIVTIQVTDEFFHVFYKGVE